MSIRRVTNGRASRQQPLASASALQDGPQWTRPAAWLPLPDVTGSQQRFAGLFAIYPDGNFLALSAAGNYTVDWGDGTVENFASGAVAYRNYTYANISNANESTLGYRQVVVQVYPQSGQNLTTLNLQQRHNQTGLNTSYVTPWLDIAVNGANLTSLSISGTTTPLRMLRQATIYSHAVTNMSNMLLSCSSLQSVPLFNTAAVTNMPNMFNGCASLQSVPLFNTAAVTNMPNMFNGCASLQSVPLFNTAAVQNMQQMFNACQSLQSVPGLNTTAVTAGNFSSVFGSCPSLVRCGMTGINQTISFASCKLSAAEINAIFNNLSNTGAGKTITVTGNYGAATCNTALATAKGWTVAT